MGATTYDVRVWEIQTRCKVEGGRKKPLRYVVRLVTGLVDLEEASWGDVDGRPLDARRLAKELGRYGARPGPLRIAGQTTKGYQVSGPTGLDDAWTRYLPPVENPPVSVTAVTAVTPQVNPVTADDLVTVTSVTPPVEHTPTRDGGRRP